MNCLDRSCAHAFKHATYGTITQYRAVKFDYHWIDVGVQQ